MTRDLYVEGSDDAHVVLHILRDAGFNAGVIRRADRPEAADALNIRTTSQESWQGIRDTIRTLPIGAGAVGFVFDMDSDEHEQRPWPSIRSALRARFPDLPIPDEPPEAGRLGAGPELRIGFWAMPQGARPGGIEGLLWDGVDPEHPLRGVAADAVQQAAAVHPDLRRADGSGRLPAAWRPKALVRTWLALQAEPGKPLGLAWKARYFAQGSPAERAFASWARRLFLGEA